MTPDQLQLLLPLIVTAATAVAAMLTVAIRRNHALACGVTICGLVLALASCLPAAVALAHLTADAEPAAHSTTAPGAENGVRPYFPGRIVIGNADT